MQRPNATAGLHHVALFSKNLEASAKFYTDLLGMRIVWQPDADNIYLSSGSDNFALHRAPDGFSANKNQKLDHIGFFLKDRADVDAWHEFLKANNVIIRALPKDHRDGARSFYIEDPDGNVVQLIYMPEGAF